MLGSSDEGVLRQCSNSSSGHYTNKRFMTFDTTATQLATSMHGPSMHAHVDCTVKTPSNRHTIELQACIMTVDIRCSQYSICLSPAGPLQR